MFFSVILPVYNVEKYLRECIDSVLEQNFIDFELILVDDGSKDNSPLICDEYALKDERIKVIHKSNGGLSDARNMGTAKATGEYIIYIDSDDFITSKNFLNDIHKKATETQSDIILYKFSKFFDDTKKLANCTFSLNFVENINDPDQLINALVKNDAYYGMAWIKAFRRKIAITNNIQFEKGLLGEDMDWYFNLILCSNTISAIDTSYIAYRQREGSITTSLKLKNLTDFIYILEKWSKKIENADTTDSKKNALLGALAKYYSNLLITYVRVSDTDKRKFADRIKKLSYLLDYSMSPRPQQIRKFYKIIGFTGVTTMLKILDKIK